jgi:hypothetical protein
MVKRFTVTSALFEDHIPEKASLEEPLSPD